MMVNILGGIIIVLLALTAYGLQVNRQNSGELEIVSRRREQLKALAQRYNNQIDGLRSSHQYSTVRSHYAASVASLKAQWKQESGPQGLKISRVWKRIFEAGFILITLGGCYGLGLENAKEPVSPLAQLADQRSWNADNIPMPHMQDHSLYVCNPDSILSEEVVDSINAVLGRLDDILGIESVMAIVGHIDGGEAIDMVRGIYEKYHVGRNDRGLVIAVGYLDHSYFIGPGRSLEADLTDLECNHLAQDYLIPSMRAEQPDSGMLYLARGVYALMADKEMPQMSALTSKTADDDVDLSFTLFPMLFIVWIVFLFIMGQKVFPTMGATPLKGNPFSDSSGGGIFFGGGGGGGGGFSGGGGGFGGGSWGGGGSGGRW